MTGEVSLTGRVLPIGGVKQKLLAAHRAGITTVLIPQRNEPDLDDVPAEVLAKLDVHPVSDVREVLALALEPASCRRGGDRRRIGKVRLVSGNGGRPGSGRPPLLFQVIQNGGVLRLVPPSITLPSGLGTARTARRCG